MMHQHFTFTSLANATTGYFFIYIIYNFEYVMLFKYHCLNSILIGLVIWLLVQTKIWGEGSLIKNLMMWALNGSKT